MKSNGFTLVELIAVITIISVMSILLISTNISTKNKANTKIYNEKITSIETAAVLWGQEHPSVFSSSNCTVGAITYKPQNNDATSYTCYTEMTVQYLLDHKYIDSDTDDNEVIDPRNKKVTLNNNKVIIYHYFSNYYAEYQE